jgi:5-hydroxyisourate hydrolase-like protein (transthyretin family)
MVAAIATNQSSIIYADEGRWLAQEQIILYGLGLRAEPKHQTVPKDIATVVSTYLQAPDAIPEGTLPIPDDAEVRAILRGPSLPGPVELVTRVNEHFDIQPLQRAGIHTLENIRVVHNGEVIFYATPESVTIEVIDRLLVTEVTARPLTAEEIKDHGIIFDSSDFQAYNFTAAFAVEPGEEIKIDFPILLPQPEPVSGVVLDQVRIPQLSGPGVQTISTIIPDTLKIAQTKIPNLMVRGFTFDIEGYEAAEFAIPPIPGVIVIPGDIGFLNQYFSVMLMVGNVAPDGSGLVVEELQAEIVLPAGNDTVVGSGDDPLRMAMTQQGESSRIQPVVKPGADGKLGTADDEDFLAPGESGNAEFLVEGMREGSHTVEMEITGTLTGLPVGPVPIRGRAAGAVLVRNPSFTLTFTHPDIVNDGEEYDLDVTVTNTSESPANFVSVNLYPRNISGASLVGDASHEIESIAAGDSASISFRLRSHVTGTVYAATLDSDEKVAGRFELKTSVGDLGIPLSPDSLVLPKEAGSLPETLRKAGIALLGKAYATATAPASVLPKEVKRFTKKMVWDRAVELAEAGLRYSLHEPLADTAKHLLMDFAGGDYARLSEEYPEAEQAGDLEAAQNDFIGFDDLRRRSFRGDVFADAITSILADDLAILGLEGFHTDFAETVSFRPEHLSVVIGTDGDLLPFRLTLADDQGLVLGEYDEENDKTIKEIPFSDYLTFTKEGGKPTAQMAIVASPQGTGYTIRLNRNPDIAQGTPFSLSIVLPADTPSGLRHVVFSGITGTNGVPVIEQLAGDPFPITVKMYDNGEQISGQTVQPAFATAIADPPPTVISVVQQADADRVNCCKGGDCSMAGVQVGRIVAMLFSEEVTPESVQDQYKKIEITNYALEENEVVAVALQPGKRIVFLALRDPVGPFIERQFTISNVSDLRGHVMTSWTGPIEATLTEPGALLTGKILHPDGTPVDMADVRYFIWNGECGWAGISARAAGVDGSYGWDFVVKNRRGKIVAIDPETNESRSVQFDVARDGQRLNVNVVFLGRGTLMGRAFAEDGFTPLEDAQLKVTSLNDYSEYGAKTDEDGWYVIPNVPTGSILVKAAYVERNEQEQQTGFSQVTVSSYITGPGETVELDLVLLSEETHEMTAQYGAIFGHVLESDNITPVPGVPVVAYYKTGSQDGVACPPPCGPPNYDCAVAFANADENGAFSFDEVPAGELRIYTFDQARFIEGESRIQLSEDGAEEVNVLLSGGLGTVRGIVLDADGNPVAGAEVGGGLSLTTTDENGVFVLEDVPVGKRSVVAVSQDIGSNGMATIDLVAEGEEVYATVVLGAMGKVTGTIFEPKGTPVPNLDVYLWEPGEDTTINVIATATTDENGQYAMEKVPISSRYRLSAFMPDFSAGNVKPLAIEFHGQTVRADVVFIGSGRINGVVYDDYGTPLKSQVSLSCLRLQRAGPVGTQFIYTQHARIIENDFTTGEFSFENVFVGPFVLATAGAFNQQMTTVYNAGFPVDVIDPTTLAGVMPYDGAVVDVALQLVPTSQITGTVYQPDGVTPVGPDVAVTFKGYKIICTANGCFERESGIQEETVVTDDDGRYWLPIVNAGKFELRAHDPVNGKLGQIRGTVQAGQTAEVDIRLLNTADVAVTVFASNGETPVPNAAVEIQHAVILDVEEGLVNNAGFLAIERSGTANNDGEISFSGGDALPEGELVVIAQDPVAGFAGRASTRITADDDAVHVNVYLFNATGSVYGTVYEPDGITPVPNAEVIISNQDGSLGYGVTGTDGDYRFDLIPLGDFDVKVFEAATGRRGIASGSIDLADQEVPMNIVESPIGFVTGTALAAGDLTPLKGWQVEIRQPNPSGSGDPLTGGTWTIWRATTAIDGGFVFPGIPVGTFDLKVEKRGVGRADVEGRITREGEIVDIPVVVSLIQDPEGTIEGWVYDPDGTPAANAEVYLNRFPPEGRGTTTDDDGAFVFENVSLGKHKILAKSQVTEDAGHTYTELAFAGETVHPVIILKGLGVVNGTVEWQDGTPANGIQVNLLSTPVPACEPAAQDLPPVCMAYADANGDFQFVNIPSGRFRVEAVNPLNPNVSGANGGILEPGSSAQVRVVLEPVGSVTGVVVASNGTPAPGVVAKLELTNPPAWTSLVLYGETDSDGRFTFSGVPVGNPIGIYRLVLEDPLGIGIATRMLSITQQGAAMDLGEIILDDTRPEVTAMDPMPGAENVPMDQVIRMTFSESVQPGTVNLESIVVTRANGEKVTGHLTIGDNDTTVTFTPLDPLQDKTRFTVRVSANPPFDILANGDSISRAEAAQCYAVLVKFDEYDSDGNGYLSEDEYPGGIEDRLGHVMERDFVASFTTVDITSPDILAVSPAPDTHGVSVESVIRVTYSEQLDPSAFTGPAITLTTGGIPVEGRVDMIAGNTGVVFTPTLSLGQDTVYQVTILPAADPSGNSQTEGVTYEFSTTDSTPPVVQGLLLSDNGTVIEGGGGTVTADVGTLYDVSFVDFYINGVLAFTDREGPFAMSFEALAEFGGPGDTVSVSAIATDTSGNRGEAVDSVFTIIADSPPNVTVSSVSTGNEAENGQRVEITVHAEDDLGITTIAYQAVGGKFPAFGTVEIDPSILSSDEDFAFYVPVDAVPGSVITVNATAVDTRGQSSEAAPVAITVLDATGPVVAFAGMTTGEKVLPGEVVTAVVSAHDSGGIVSVSFEVSGATVYSETRAISPAPASVASTFNFTVSRAALPADTVIMQAVAVDQAGNSTTSAQVILPVADTIPPNVITLETETGSLEVTPGQQVGIIVGATDEIGVARIELTGSGAFTYSDAHQVSPPLGSAQTTFTIDIPDTVNDGDTLVLEAIAADVSGYVSIPVTITLTVRSLIEVTLPQSLIILAGETQDVTVELDKPAPAGGVRIDFESEDTSLATVVPSVTVAQGETSAQFSVTGVTGGSPVISAYISGALRASMTVTVRGGVVTGTVMAETTPGQLDPVSAAEVNVNGIITNSDSDGRFLVEGLTGLAVTIKAYDPASKLKGYATGTMSAYNGYLHDVIVVLVPAGTVTGTVILQDGQTPAGEGVKVELFSYHHTGGEPLQSVFTDSDSRFEFPLVELGDYDIDASDLVSGNRGRTEVFVTESGQEIDTLIAYLGRGNVSVTVVDGGGDPVPNAELRFNAYSIFGSESFERTALGDGAYAFENIFLGDFTITAQHPTANTGGSISDSITFHGELVEITLPVGAWASLEGTIYRSDETTTTVAGAQVSAGHAGRTVTDENGFYRFEILPLGSYSVDVVHEITRGMGSASITLLTNSVTEQLNITLLGQGTVIVTVEDAYGQPAPGAAVTLSDPWWGHPISEVADANGVAMIQQVNEGAFTVIATASGLSGEVEGTLATGAILNVTIELEPAGSITGTVYGPDESTPAENAQVRLLQGGYGWLPPVITGADGQFLFEGLRIFDHSGNPILYRLEAYEGGELNAYGAYVGGQLRGRVEDVIIETNGQIVTQNLVLVGLGTVEGRVLMPDSSSAGDMPVTVRSLTPVFGKTWSVRTDAAGYYTVERVPVGTCTVTSGDIDDQLWGEGEGEIVNNGDIITVDILLENNAITLPRDMFDANHFRFDVQEDGVIKYGLYSVFHPIPDLGINGGATLAIVADGTEYTFSGGEIPTQEDLEREIVVRETGLSGLNVTRKIYVPLEGYFARYLEILTNPTSETITVDLQVKTGFHDYKTEIIATSSGDDVLEVDGTATSDRWVVVDEDTTGDPFLPIYGNKAPAAFLWSGPDAGDDPEAIEWMPYAYPIYPNLTAQWDTVSVPPGESVAFMHFVVQQASREAAQASVERLVQLPPEALAGMSLAEIDVVQNFAIPEDGSSNLEPLPPMNAEASGMVLASDGTTIGYPSCTVYLKSSHLLFGRTYQVLTNTSGQFQFIPDPVTNPAYAPIIGIPVADLTLSATIKTYYPRGSTSPEIACSFAEGSHILNQNIIFSNTGMFAGVVKQANGELVDNAIVTFDLIIEESPYYETRGKTNSIEDGSYLAGFLPPGDYTLTVAVPHAQGYAAETSVSGSIIEGETAIVDISMPPLGDISGVVTGPDDTVIYNALVELRETEGDYFRRQTRTDTAGNYTLYDVPVGTYTVTAFDPVTGGPLVYTITVADEETLTVNFPLPVFATLPTELYDGSGFLWDVQKNGQINDGTDNAYGSRGLNLIIDTYGFAGFYTAVSEDGGRELKIGPDINSYMGDVQVSRKVFVPEDDGFARYLEIVENNGSDEVTVQLKIQTYLGSGSATEVLATSSGDTVFNTWDLYIITDDGEDGTGTPAMVHVVSSDYAEVKPAEINMLYGYYIATTYDVTVPAGERRIIMHFASQNTDRAAAFAKAEQLRHLEGSALEGLSADEQADIINFVACDDADHDGLPDIQEDIVGTNSGIPDSDEDGLLDGFEAYWGFDPLSAVETGEGILDPDEDGLNNIGEQDAGTDPFDSDTDGGGQMDGAEVNDVGSDPLNFDDDLFALPLNLYDANGFLWDVQGNGGIRSGTDNAYHSYFIYGGLMLTVNSSLFPSLTTALPENGGRELTIGSQSYGDLLVDRKLFVPEDDSFVRYLEILENTNDTEPVTATIQISSYLGSLSSTQIITTSTGDQNFNAADDYIITDDNSDGTGTPTMAHVFSGAYAEVEPTVAELYGTSQIRLTFEVTIPAGERRIIMHFASQNSNQTIAAASADALHCLAGSALTGLSPEEQADIVNFRE